MTPLLPLPLPIRSGFSYRTVIHRIRSPNPTPSYRHAPYRSAITQQIASADSDQILVKQRQIDPRFPSRHLRMGNHLNQLLAHAHHRHYFFSGALYVFGTAYLAAPLFGWHLGSVNIAPKFGTLPRAAKVVAKFVLAWPFAFHDFNGLRYLVWDTGRQLSTAQVNRTGLVVLGVSTAAALVLAMLYYGLRVREMGEAGCFRKIHWR